MTEVAAAQVDQSPEKVVQEKVDPEVSSPKAEELEMEAKEGSAEASLQLEVEAEGDSKAQRHEGSPSTDDSNSSKGEDQESSNQPEEQVEEEPVSSEVQSEAEKALEEQEEEEEAVQEAQIEPVQESAPIEQPEEKEEVLEQEEEPEQTLEKEEEVKEEEQEVSQPIEEQDEQVEFENTQTNDVASVEAVSDNVANTSQSLQEAVKDAIEKCSDEEAQTKAIEDAVDSVMDAFDQEVKQQVQENQEAIKEIEKSEPQVQEEEKPLKEEVVEHKEEEEVQEEKVEQSQDSRQSLAPEPENEKASQEQKDKADALQKEKDALRAPFAELMNSFKKKMEAGLERKPKNRIQDISKTIFVDSYILNYASFYPGKLLGSTLQVGNTSEYEQIVELSIDSNTFSFNKTQIKDKYGNPQLPFSLDQEEKSGKSSSNTIVNSELKHESWFIENPISKELTKRITLKLGPKAEQEFIIVVRAPNSKKCENLLSLLNISLLTYGDEQFGARDSFEDFLKSNYNGSMKEFLKDRKKVAAQQKMEILLAGRVEVPNIICPKQMHVHELDEKIIPIAIKKGQPNQKFRIPFKNTGPSEVEVDFSFLKQSYVIYRPEDESEEKRPETSPCDLQCVPASAKIPSGGNAIVTITAKLKNSYQLAMMSKQNSKKSAEEEEKRSAKPEKYSHMLIGKVKDTQIMFPFITEVSLIESNGKEAGLA